MARRSTVGLDIGTSSVRAAELSFGKGRTTLERFGQVALPVGAVRDGEVVDVEIVAAAIRTLWSQAKFSSKKVVVGVANQRVVVRQVDLPWLAPAELRASLPFQVQEYIPMPTEQAILDFHAIEEPGDGTGPRLIRGLLVAAAREMVATAVAAVERAGLRPVMVDLTPFAVIRSLVVRDELGLSGAEAEALVDIGASVTNIVIHQGGVPRFVRILLMGGGDVTEAIAERMGVPLDQAEALKQSTGMVAAPGIVDPHPASRVIEHTGAGLIEEVRGSLDYYLSQPGSARLRRVVVSGGGAQLGGIRERLAAATRLPVESGSALSNIHVGRTGLSAAQLEHVEPLASVSVGLAMGIAS